MVEKKRHYVSPFLSHFRVEPFLKHRTQFWAPINTTLNFSGHLFSELVESDLVQEELNNHEQLQRLIEWFSSTYVGGIICLFMRIVKEMLRGPLNLKSVVYFSQICPLPLLSSNQLNKN